MELSENREARRKFLVEAYGQPQRIHAGEPLRLLDLRDKIHPSDVIAYVYSSLAAFNAYSTANQRFNGFPSYGPLVMAPNKVIGVLDYRSTLPLLTDPKLSDDTPAASAQPNV